MLERSRSCVILVGMPGSGKSTYINSYECPYMYSTTLSTDDIIEDIAKTYGCSYSDIWKEGISLATKLYDRYTAKTIAQGLSVVIDRTNLTKKSRKKIIDKFRYYGYKITCVVFSTPEEKEWSRRLSSRKDKHIPREQLDAMLKRYEEPTIDEGMNEIIYINN
jgi:predicted kinase